MYSLSIRDKAIKLRKEGKSYKEIMSILHVPKSTLSNWVGENLHTAFGSDNWLKHLANIRPLAVEMKKKAKLEDLEKFKINAEKEVSRYSLDTKYFQKSMLSMLYWAEGSKHEKMSGLKFTNTDPKLIDLFVSLLRNCYELDEGKFRIYLYLHYYHPIIKTRKFWSEVTCVSEEKFGATVMKKRSKTRRFRKNFMGICTVFYGSSSIRKELMAIGQAIHQKLGKNNIL